MIDRVFPIYLERVESIFYTNYVGLKGTRNDCTTIGQNVLINFISATSPIEKDGMPDGGRCPQPRPWRSTQLHPSRKSGAVATSAHGFSVFSLLTW